MRAYRLRLIVLILVISGWQNITNAQGYSFNCAHDTLVPACPATFCITLQTLIPDPQRAATTYAVNAPGTLPSCLLAQGNPGVPGQPTTLNLDDLYSPVFPIGFPFVFFGQPYSSLVVSSNGYLCFDITRTGLFSHWNIINGSTPQDLPSTFYDKALIMGPYHDIDIAYTTSPNRLISYQTSGIAPYRTWTITYYQIPLFQCTTLIQNTHQITLYESTGIIDVNIYDMEICPTWNQGRAMVGVQDMNRTTGVMVPGRRASDPPWGSIGMNEKWRFIPINGTPLFRRVELYDINGVLLSTGTTVPLPNGDRQASFPNICAPVGTSTPYVIKAFYDKIDDPATEIFAYDTIRVNRTQALIATTTSTNAVCASANGSITVTSTSGGTGTYQYSIDGGVTWQTSNTFPGLASGPYTIMIHDVGGTCTSSYTVNVGQTSTLTASTSSTVASCPGVNNGTITILSSSGTGPFTFSMDGGPFVGGPLPYTFTNMSAGSHTVIVRDANGCVTSVTQSVASGSGPNGFTSTLSATCPGVPNGTIIINMTSGVGPYTYTLDGNPAGSGGASYIIPNVTSGSHTVIAADAGGCTHTFIVVVAAGGGIGGNATMTAASCPGVNNGTITANALSGNSPWTYQLDGGAFMPGPNPYTFNNVAPGSHTVVIKDATGCSKSVTITVTAGTSMAASATSSATSCSGATDGSIVVTPTSGTSPYTYSLDGAPAVPNAGPYTFNNVPAGPHTVVVSDVNGCITNQISVTVVAGPPLDATLTPSATTCSGASNGSILVTPTNGTGPYVFSLDGAPGVSGPGPYTFNNVPAGNHNVVMSDASGCATNQISVTVVPGPLLTTTATTSDALCNGAPNGSITVAQPSAGTAPYQYSLDGVTWQSSNVFNGLAAGTYTVYFHEANGCQNTLSITVNEPSSMTSSATTVAAVCNGQNNGIVTVTANGGVGPYQYSIDGGVTWQSGNIFNVGAGSYTVTIKDVNNCTRTQPVTVTEPAPLTASSANSNASCNGGSDGVITVNAAGGNSGYSYSIDGGATWQGANVFNVGPGNYTINVKDNLGCTTTFNTTVGLTNNLNFTPQTDPTICEGTSTQLQLVSNATIYSWTPTTGLSNPSIYNPVANPTATTTYTVTATLGRCTATDDVIVNVNPAPIPDAGADGFICYGQTYQLHATGGVSYTWSPVTYLDDPHIANPTASPPKTFTYTLTQVVDALGCSSLTTDVVTVDVTPPIKVKTYPYDSIAYPGDQFQILATSVATNYNWSPPFGLSDPTIANPVLTVGPIGADVTYQVTASTAAGCKGEGYVHIKVYTGPDIYVPNGFSPNGDGKNDKFVPFPVGIASLKYFRVYNRWGQLVFSTSQLNDGWDGRLSGIEQPSGVYVWMAEAITKGGKTITKKGTVMLIR